MLGRGRFKQSRFAPNQAGMRVDSASSASAVHSVKVAKLSQDVGKQEGKTALKLIESAMPEGTRGHNVNTVA